MSLIIASSDNMAPRVTTAIFAAAGTFILLFAVRLLQKRGKKGEEDPYHRARFKSNKFADSIVLHYGTCHCSKVNFCIRAPRDITAVDVPSKLRFPRVSVGYEEFEWTSDHGVLSMYSVQVPESGAVGVHIFCSFCGMQIVFSPSLDPMEIQVNLDCLDAGTIEKVDVAYHATVETVPTIPELQSISRRGSSTCGQSYNHYIHGHMGRDRLMGSLLEGGEQSDTTDDIFGNQLSHISDLDSCSVLSIESDVMLRHRTLSSMSSSFKSPHVDEASYNYGSSSSRVTPSGSSSKSHRSVFSDRSVPEVPLDLPLYQNLRKRLSHHMPDHK